MYILSHALEKVQKRRSIVRPNPGFVMQLKKLETELGGEKLERSTIRQSYSVNSKVSKQTQKQPSKKPSRL